MGAIRRYLRHSVAKFGAASVLARTISITTTLILTPLAIAQLGPAGFGLWVLATQIPSLIVSPDLGLTLGLVNEINDETRKGTDRTALASRLLGAEKLLRLIAASWLLIGLLVATTYSLLSTDSRDTALTMAGALALALACFTAGIPATVWTRFQLAIEQAHISVRWEAAAKLTSLILCTAVLLIVPNLALLIIAFLAPSTVALWLNARSCVKTHLPEASDLKPPRIAEAFTENRQAFNSGKFFVIMQLSYLIATALDPFVIDSLLTTKEVAWWSVIRRPFDVLPLLTGLFSTALWPVFRRMHEAREQARLSRTIALIVGLSLMSSVAFSTIVIFFRDPIFNYLSHGKLSVALPVLVAMAIAGTCSGLTLIVSNYLFAAGMVRPQAIVVGAGAVALLTAKFIATSEFGLSGYFTALALSAFLFQLVPQMILVIHSLRSRKKQSPK